MGTLDQCTEENAAGLTANGWAAYDKSGILKPFEYKLREVGPEDVVIQVLFCGVCHTDLHQLRDDYGFSRYPMVAGFVVRIPDKLPLDEAAPLLCAGITVYSPMKFHGLTNESSGKKCGVVGLGGVGHMAVKFAKAFGLHVTVISSSPSKEQEACQVLGADAFLLSSNGTNIKNAEETLDFILDTVPSAHPLEPYLSLLKVNGKIVLLGVPPTPLAFAAPMLHMGRRSIGGSFIGGMEETQEMLNFSAEKGVRCMIEVVHMDYINEAMERLEKNDVRYRFVVNVGGNTST